MIALKKLKHLDNIARSIANQSPDSQTKVGAIIVDKETGSHICSGFNGFVRGADDKNLPNTRPDKYAYIVHAEMNAVCNAALMGVSTKNSFLYCTLSPCINCCRVAFQAGIDTIYFKEVYGDFEKNRKMKDLRFIVEKIGEFSKLTLQPIKEGEED